MTGAHGELLTENEHRDAIRGMGQSSRSQTTIRRSVPPTAEAAVLCARKDERTGALLNRLASRLGKAKAYSALAHKRGRAFHHMPRAKAVFGVSRCARHGAAARPARRRRTGARGAGHSDDNPLSLDHESASGRPRHSPGSRPLGGDAGRARVLRNRGGNRRRRRGGGSGDERAQREAVPGKRAGCRGTPPPIRPTPAAAPPPDQEGPPDDPPRP